MKEKTKEQFNTTSSNKAKQDLLSATIYQISILFTDFHDHRASYSEKLKEHLLK